MPAPTPIIILIKAGAASYDPPCRSVGDAAASLSIIRGPGLRLIGLGVVCMWVFLVLARSVCNAAVLVGRQMGAGAAARESLQAQLQRSWGDSRKALCKVTSLVLLNVCIIASLSLFLLSLLPFPFFPASAHSQCYCKRSRNNGIQGDSKPHSFSNLLSRTLLYRPAW